MATEEETIVSRKKQGVIEHRKVGIRKSGEIILMNTYILTFNSSKGGMNGFTIEMVEIYIPISLQSFKCQKFGRHKDKYKRKQVVRKCGEKKSPPMRKTTGRMRDVRTDMGSIRPFQRYLIYTEGRRRYYRCNTPKMYNSQKPKESLVNI